MAGQRWLSPGVALGALCAAIVLWQTRNGPSISPDSEAYLRVAASIRHGDGVPGGYEGTIRPPGLPMLLAVGDSFGLSALNASRIITAVSAGVVVWLVWCHLARTCTPVAAVVAASVVAVSSSLLEVSRFVWSEAPFIAVTLGVLTMLDREHTERRLLVAAALVWAAFLFRYAGLVLVPVGFVVVVVRQRSARLAAMFAGAALIGPAIWMARNYRITGTFMGERPASEVDRWSVIPTGLGTVGRWALPFVGLTSNAYAVVGVVVLAVLAIAAVRCRMLVHGVFVAVYLAYSVESQWKYFLDPLTNRLMAPVFPSLVIIAATKITHRLPYLQSRAVAARPTHHMTTQRLSQ